MSKNRDYAEKYAEYAKEQMIKYGIPASVTLAQGILESSNGNSELAQKGNAHFGIKCTEKWLENGGGYLTYTDDRPNEKFCTYKTVAESFEHHSEFLKNNSRYEECFALSPDNYKGWCDGLGKAGYATSKGYSDILQNIIKKNGLDKYDKEVMEAGYGKGLSAGSPRNDEKETKNENSYSFPIKRNDFLLVTSPFGVREDPLNKGEERMHNGLDIRTNHDDVLATENGGLITSVNNNSMSEGGKSVTIAYERKDGGKTEVTYMHLDQINVKEGERVNAGESIGISGNTGTRTNGEHLHMNVKQITPEGKARNIDPTAYLYEIAEKGNIRTEVMYNGENLLSKYDKEDSLKNGTGLTTEEWMKKLLSSEDSGLGMGGDPLMEMIMALYSGLMVMANQLDNKTTTQEKMESATNAVLDKKIDISKLLPQNGKSEILLEKNGKIFLTSTIDGNSIKHELSKAELNSLNRAIASETMSDSEKSKLVSSTLGQIVATKQAGQNFEMEMQKNYREGEQLKM